MLCNKIFYANRLNDQTDRACPISEDNLQTSNCDGVILISWPNAAVLKGLSNYIEAAIQLDPGLSTETAVIAVPDVPGGRIVHSPTGPIDSDYDDVRIFKVATEKGIKRAIKAGIKKPLFVLRKHENFENCELVMLLGALEALYVVSNL